jgi:hypothetical protein
VRRRDRAGRRAALVVASQSPEQDVRVLNLLEYTESAFSSEALQGDMRSFAELPVGTPVTIR